MGELMYEYKLRFTDEAQANAVLDAALGSLKIWDYEKHVIGIHTECLAYGDDGECLESLTWDGWHVDVIAVTELAIPAEFVKNPLPDSQIHAFFN